MNCIKSFAKFTGSTLLATFLSLVLPVIPSAQAMPGYAMLFNGTNNYVWVDRPVADDFTIEFWFNSTQVAGTNTQWWQGMGLVDGEVSGAYADFGVSLGAGTVVFGTGGAGDVSIRSGVVADGKWHHVAAVRSRSSGLMGLYIDGTLEASGWGSMVRLDASRQLRFGSLASGVNFFRGQLDEVKIWSSVRTVAEIQSDMRATPARSELNLAGYWPFCEGPATIQTADLSRHWFHGHLVNRPFWIPSPVGWTPTVELNGANPATNECHAAFVDPGADLVGPPAAISAAVYHHLVLRADGTLCAWGSSMVSGLDVPAGPDLRFASITAGGFFNQGLKVDGTVEGAGGDGGSWIAGALNSSTGIVAIAAGAYHTVALKSDGRINAAGYSFYGATAVPASATNVVVISAYDSLNLILRTDGTVVGWGQSPYSHTPPADASNLVSLAAGGNQGIALRADGAVVVWGNNSYAQLNIPSTATRVVAVAAGEYHCLALRDDGSVIAWGDNGQGQTNVPPAATNIVAIAASYNHNLALRADGRIIAWGSTEYGLQNVPPGVGRWPLAGDGVVDANSPGIYQRTHTYTNVERSVLTTNRLVVVADTTLPSLNLKDSNSMVVRAGTGWVEPGATALDTCAGELTGGIVITGRVDVGLCGLYRLGYSVTDPGGNTALTNRVVLVGDLPGISGISSSIAATNPVTGGRRAQLGIDVNPNGLPTAVSFQYWLTDGHEGVSQPPLVTGFAASNLACAVEGLMQGTTYHWRVVASNSLGVATSPDQILEVPALYALGDRNGDGVVDGSEFNAVLGNLHGNGTVESSEFGAVLAKLHGSGVVGQADLGLVLSNYWPNSGWLRMTNVAGLGGRNVTFALTNDLSGAFSVESSTDLLNWSLLGTAVPRYEYWDTNAPAGPQRYYRLRWP